jgi:hypothetical protein
MIELKYEREWVLDEFRGAPLYDFRPGTCYLCSLRTVVQESIQTLWMENITKENYAQFLSANSWIWHFLCGAHCTRGLKWMRGV